MNTQVYTEVSNTIEHLGRMDTLPDSDVKGFAKSLAAQLNQLIAEDFAAVVHMLYRLDIDEKQLKKQLENNAQPAGEVMARMIIERQQQKIASRKMFAITRNISPDEAW